MEGKAEQLFSDLGRKLDELITKGKNSDYVKNLDLNSRMEELKRNKEKLETDFKSFADHSDEHWKTLEERGKAITEDIKDALDTLFRKKERS